LKRKFKILLITAGVIITPVLLSPMPRFKAPLSTVVGANDGSLLGARIADDGQWRFPPADSVPEKFEKALLTFEDNYFYYHPGINPVSVMRALISNIKAGKVVSGGSTLTMQAARLSRGNRPRTYPEKIIEMFSALKLEIFRSKKEILEMYAANAPFGGNTVGLEAASWRYSGIPAYNLSWAEAAAFAVLPNAPSLVFPGKNQEILKRRRDELLRKMFASHYFDSITLTLALEEPLPVEPKILPSKAPHLTDLFLKKSKGSRIITTIDPVIQEKVTEIVNSHQRILENNQIHNLACIIEKVETGEVIAYIGNSSTNDTAANGGDVDIIQSLRSTGSILKPVLYAGMQFSGDILPNTLIPDIPTRFPGFSPKNFDQTWSGAVTASNALSQSLNIPSVRMLQKYNPERFLTLLKEAGFTTFNKSAGYYGLSLILGGGETSLWELCGVYASLSRILNRFNKDQKYSMSDFHPPVLVKNGSKVLSDTVKTEMPLSAASVWLTYEALQKVNRPESESGWQYFSSSQNCAWKTGTSFGFRDAWAVGTTPEFVIAVWAGNADGEGRPGLTGVTAAAPVLFDVLNFLGSEKWFVRPSEEMTTIKVCTSSGYRAGPDCSETEEIWACVSGLKSETCPYHHIIHLNKAKTMRVTSACSEPSDIINELWFVLPPAIEYFYKQKHPEYKTVPPPAPGCPDDKSIPVMEYIYPSQGVKIFIPRDQTGALTRVIPEIAHRIPSKKIFWHLDNNFITTTRFIHQIDLLASPGTHLLTAVDEDGNSIKCTFEITGSPGQTLRK
jgi:penicillin-binding protein 1C